MAGQHNFEHLPLLLRYRGRARLPSGGKTNPQTLANRNARQAHSTTLRGAAQALSGNWKQRQAQRQGQALPVIPNGIPILLQVDTGLDLDVLRERFAFEIVAEQEEGYVIVASEDIDVGLFLAMLDGFAVEIHGSATIASVHRLFDDPNQADRLSRIFRIGSSPSGGQSPTIRSSSSMLASPAREHRRFHRCRSAASAIPMPHGPQRNSLGRKRATPPMTVGSVEDRAREPDRGIPRLLPRGDPPQHRWRAVRCWRVARQLHSAAQDFREGAEGLCPELSLHL